MKSRQTAALSANPFLSWGTPGMKAMQMASRTIPQTMQRQRRLADTLMRRTTGR
jgi:hypothetical protein